MKNLQTYSEFLNLSEALAQKNELIAQLLTIRNNMEEFLEKWNSGESLGVLDSEGSRYFEITMEEIFVNYEESIPYFLEHGRVDSPDAHGWEGYSSMEEYEEYEEGLNAALRTVIESFNVEPFIKWLRASDFDSWPNPNANPEINDMDKVDLVLIDVFYYAKFGSLMPSEAVRKAFMTKVGGVLGLSKLSDDQLTAIMHSLRGHKLKKFGV